MIPRSPGGRWRSTDSMGCLSVRATSIARRGKVLNGWLIAALGSGLLSIECCHGIMGKSILPSAAANAVQRPRQELRKDHGRRQHRQQRENRFEHQHRREHRRHQSQVNHQFQSQHHRRTDLEPAPPPPPAFRHPPQANARNPSSMFGPEGVSGRGVADGRRALLSTWGAGRLAESGHADDGVGLSQTLRVARGSGDAWVGEPAAGTDGTATAAVGDAFSGKGAATATEKAIDYGGLRFWEVEYDYYRADYAVSSASTAFVVETDQEEEGEVEKGRVSDGSDGEVQLRRTFLFWNNFLRHSAGAEERVHDSGVSNGGVFGVRMGGPGQADAASPESASVRGHLLGVGVPKDGVQGTDGEFLQPCGKAEGDRENVVRDCVRHRVTHPPDQAVGEGKGVLAEEKKQFLRQDLARQPPQRLFIESGRAFWDDDKRLVRDADRPVRAAQQPTRRARRPIRYTARPSLVTRRTQHHHNEQQQQQQQQQRQQQPQPQQQQQQQTQQQQRQRRQQVRNLEPKPRKLLDEVELWQFPGGFELTCDTMVAGGGAAVFTPLENDVIVRGSKANVTWSLDPFQSTSSISDGSSSLREDLNVELVNVTLFQDDTALYSYNDRPNSAIFEWTVPRDVDQGRDYKIAVWDEASGVCSISDFFGISLPQSVNVSTFHGYRWSGGSISPVERNYSDAPGEDVPVYSCNGAMEVRWNTTGLMEKVEIRVCQEPGAYGSLGGLEDENLSDDSDGSGAGGGTCLEPTGDGVILANASYANVTLAGDESTCGVYGDQFYAKVSRADERGVLVEGSSQTRRVLGGSFHIPNSTYTEPLSVYSQQFIMWEGLASAGDTAEVDIVLRKRTDTTSEVYSVIAEGDTRGPTDGVFTWSDPQANLSPADLEDSGLMDFKFFLEVYDAVGGGLLCRSDEFSLVAEVPSTASSDPSTLLLLFTPAALLLLCFCGVLCVACPYYEKIVRRRLLEMGPSVIDVDDTYVIDGEGQPAILALSAQVIPLAHATYWPDDVSSAQASLRIRRAASGNWARAVFSMGQSVTESIGRAARLAVGGVGGASTTHAGSVSGSGSDSVVGRYVPGSGSFDVCGPLAGGGAAVWGGGSIEAASSTSSWGVMRSGATWAFGGGGSVGRRGGGRRDGGGVYPTAAAALRINQDLEEKSEAVASAGAGSSAASTASGGGGVVVREPTATINGRTSEETNGVHIAAANAIFNNAEVTEDRTATTAVAPSSSWYSRQSSRADLLGISHERAGGINVGGAARSGSGRSTRSGIAGGGVFRGRGASAGAESVVTVLVTDVEAVPVEIVQVAIAVPIDDAGFEIPTSTMVGMEILEGFSDHGSCDDNAADSSLVAIV